MDAVMLSFLVDLAACIIRHRTRRAKQLSPSWFASWYEVEDASPQVEIN